MRLFRFARIAEVSLREVDQGLIEAAQAMGCNRKQIIWHVLLPEALPGIVAGFTVTIVTMINSSAIAGAIGAGGLETLLIDMVINVLICKLCWLLF